MNEKKENMNTLKQYFNTAIRNQTLVIVLLVLGYVYPIGVYAMWKAKHFKPTTRWIVTVLMVCRFIVANIIFTGAPEYVDPYGSSSDCTEVMESNGCTYYRDSNCNVIAKYCE